MRSRVYLTWIVINFHILGELGASRRDYGAELAANVTSKSEPLDGVVLVIECLIRPADSAEAHAFAPAFDSCRPSSQSATLSFGGCMSGMVEITARHL